MYSLSLAETASSNQTPTTAVEEIWGTIQFENNSAALAGDVLLGGNVDKCYIYPASDLNTIVNGNAKTYSNYKHNIHGSEVFNPTFNYSSQRGLSVISSDPVAICLCKDGEPRCDLRSMSIEAYPGEPFTVDAVGVGQRNGVTPTIVHAYHHEIHSDFFLEDPHLQKVSTQCSPVTYIVDSQKSFEEIFLFHTLSTNCQTLMMPD